MIIIPEDRVCAGSLLIAAHLGEVVTELYILYISQLRENTEKQALKEYFSALFQGKKTADEEFESRLESYGWRLDHRYQVIRFLPETRVLSSKNLEFFCIQVENAFPSMIAFHFFDSVYAVMNVSADVSMEKHDQNMAYFLRDNICKAGFSNCFHNLRKCLIFMREADLALELGNPQNPTFWYYRFENYAYDYLLRKCVEDLPMEELVSPVLKKLRKYDEDHPGSELYASLHQYFLCDYNASVTAELLHVHRTTFLYRMRRIEEITRMKFDSPREKSYLFLSYLLEEKADENAHKIV